MDKTIIKTFQVGTNTVAVPVKVKDKATKPAPDPLKRKDGTLSIYPR